MYPSGKGHIFVWFVCASKWVLRSQLCMDYCTVSPQTVFFFQCVKELLQCCVCSNFQLLSFNDPERWFTLLMNKLMIRLCLLIIIVQSIEREGLDVICYGIV